MDQLSIKAEQKKVRNSINLSIIIIHKSRYSTNKKRSGFFSYRVNKEYDLIDLVCNLYSCSCHMSPLPLSATLRHLKHTYYPIRKSTDGEIITSGVITKQDRGCRFYLSIRLWLLYEFLCPNLTSITVCLHSLNTLLKKKSNCTLW